MIQPSARLLIAAASAFLGLPDVRLPNASEQADADDGTSLLQRWGYWSHFDHGCERSSWPLLEARTADELAALAAARFVLHHEPERGDIFLQFSPLSKRFVRTGVVAEVRSKGQYDKRRPYYDVMTIEGASSEHGMLGGRHTVLVARRFLPASGDRFLRWVKLDRCIGATEGDSAFAQSCCRVEQAAVEAGGDLGERRAA